MNSIVVMYRFPFFGFCRASFFLAIVGMCLASSVSLLAGEKILLGNEKTKVNPDKKSQLNKETLKSWGKVDNDPLGDLLMQPNRSFDGVDLKKEKQKKLKRMEEMNWMFVNPGELTDENDAKLVGRDEDPSKTLEKDDETLMFRGLTDGKTPAGNPSSSSKSLGKSGKNEKNPPPRIAKSQNDESSRTSRPLFSSKSENSASLNTDSALEFKKLLRSSSRGNVASEKSESSMGSLFNPGTVSVLSQSQKASRQEYSTFINGSQGIPAAAGASADLPKWSGASVNPLLPKPTESIARSSGIGSYGTGINRSGSGVDAAGGWNVGVSGFNTLPPANLTPRSTANQFSSPGFEPARRGMGSLGGH